MPSLKVTLLSFNAANHFSLANGFLKAYAEKDGWLRKRVHIDLLDFSVESNDARQALFYLSKTRPHILGLSCYCWNVEVSLEVARFYKTIVPESIIVLGGPEVAPIAEDYLRQHEAVDIIVRGEGEATFQELLKELVRGRQLSAKIKGISYRQGTTIVNTPERPPIPNLGEIPSPYLTGVLTPREGVTYVETSRGCPFHCAYCYEGKNFPKVRFYPEKRIQKEIELISNTPGITSFHLVDSVFNLKKDRLRRLAQLISEANQSGARLLTVEIIAENVDEETVSLLRQANVASVETGPQTVHHDTLLLMQRQYQPEKFARAIKLLQDSGIQVLCDLIVGLPGDNFFRVVRSIRSVMAMQPARLIFSALHVLPGTELYHNAPLYGLRFDQRAPHLVIDTDSFPFEEIDRAVLMSTSVAREYNLKID
ncbi:MAG: B12-binding domain-containing radical SAM protein [Deltaproteobacteria bacterium]|nr:B12-binding domain-containing radical SAM protein [Deltaproteobacteria bacterium]MBW2072795.1 B12-binding domain-containing radical SAM protein [Deltaproteobacteria bacterium]